MRAHDRRRLLVVTGCWVLADGWTPLCITCWLQRGDPSQAPSDFLCVVQRIARRRSVPARVTAVLCGMMGAPSIVSFASRGARSPIGRFWRDCRVQKSVALRPPPWCQTVSKTSQALIAAAAERAAVARELPPPPVGIRAWMLAVRWQQPCGAPSRWRAACTAACTATAVSAACNP